ncbi:MAG: HAD-IB family phosphatase [Candidatus Heimdallarchaeota archaeon]|nr:HAD-IB family phosphatase [Candidatus Heimdallarchaeota archaeon]
MIILCDFDGTITDSDSCVIVLEQFTKNWEIYDDYLDQGKMTLKQAMEAQFGLITTPPSEILSFLADKVQIRSGFEEFVKYCKNNGIELIIVSAGLDFIIKEFLPMELPLICAETHFEDKLLLRFPEQKFPDAIDFKEDMVRYYREKGEKVIFIGDGGSDFRGAAVADEVYAIRGKRLHDHITRSIPFDNFSEIVTKLSEK